MPSDNLDLRDELAGLMGWTCDDTFLPNIGPVDLWRKGDKYKHVPSGGAFHPIDNTLDAASAAIREAGCGWWNRNLGNWFIYLKFDEPPIEVRDTGDEARDLLALACAVWRAKNKEQNDGK